MTTCFICEKLLTCCKGLTKLLTDSPNQQIFTIKIVNNNCNSPPEEKHLCKKCYQDYRRKRKMDTLDNFSL